MKNNIAKAPTYLRCEDRLYITVLTWEKDSHGLFDYQATKHHKEHFEIHGPCKLYRNWHTSKVCVVSNDQIKKGHLPDEMFSFHASVSLKHNGNHEQFVLGAPDKLSQEIPKRDNPEETGPINTNTYLIVKANKFHPHHSGYPMKSGNIIKLGRVEFSVIETGGTKLKGKAEDIFLKEFDGTYVVDNPAEGSCKFCLCEEQTDDNILISPCNCKGSCQGVHIECLKMWINSKIKKQVNGVVSSYNFAKFECEICKTPFPTKVVNGKKTTQMLQIEKPDKPYLILQNINQRRDSKEERCLHVITMEEGGVIKMGRGHQCQIRLQDISVSRTHSQIKYQDGQFFLKDSNSKFGTLVRLNQPLPFQREKKIKLQVGRSTYEFNCL